MQMIDIAPKRILRSRSWLRMFRNVAWQIPLLRMFRSTMEESSGTFMHWLRKHFFMRMQFPYTGIAIGRNAYENW